METDKKFVRIAEKKERMRDFAFEVAPDMELLEDLVYSKEGGLPLKMDIMLTKKLSGRNLPSVVFIHGGGWSGGLKEGARISIMPDLVRRGYIAASIEYRLTDEAIFPAQIHDCKCAIRFLRAHAKEYHIDPERIGVWGGSAGGHLAALLGTSGDVKELEGEGGWQEYSSRVQAVCNFSGPSDFLAIDKAAQGREDLNQPVEGLLGGLIQKNKAMAALSSPVTHINAGTPPVLIVHGKKDDLVPVSQAEIFYKALKKAGRDVVLKVFENGGHGFSQEDSVDAHKTALDFFDKKLKK